jgi:hypothetical protein
MKYQMASEFRHKIVNNILNVMDSKLQLETSEFSARCTSRNIHFLQSGANELAGKPDKLKYLNRRSRIKGSLFYKSCIRVISKQILQISAYYGNKM